MKFFLENFKWLLACSLMYFSSCFGQTFFISLYANEIRSFFQLSHGDWGSIYALGTLASAFMMLVLGGLVDKYEFKKLLILVFISLSILCFTMVLNSSLWILIGIIFGLRFFGQGMLFHLPSVAIGRWFGQNKGKATSISVLGFSLGEAIFPIIMTFIISFVGWKFSWSFGGVLLLLILPFIVTLLKVERTPKSSKNQVIEQTGLNGKHWTRKQVLKFWLFWSVIIPLLITPIFSTAFFFYQMHLIDIKNFNVVKYFSIFPIYTISSMSALIFSGWLIDKLGVSKFLPYYLIPMALGLISFSIGDNYFYVFIGFIFLGITQGSAMTIGSTFWPNYFGTKNLGSIRSLSTSSMVFGTALGPVIVGQLLDLNVSYNYILFGMSILAIASCISLFITMSRIPNLK